MEEEFYSDHVLRTLYSVWTQSGGEFGVSLLVGGTWVTGMAITGRAWMEQLAHVVDQAPRGGKMGATFKQLGQLIYPAESEVEAGVVEPDDNDEPPLIGFIHLRDARAVGGGGLHIPNDGGLVRVRLSSVDGWLLGNIGPDGYTPAPPPL